MDEPGELITTFFAAFRSGGEALPALREAFLPGAVIVKACGGVPEVYDVDGFIAPRAALLQGGSLQDFSEWPETGRLEIFGDIAQWFGSYAKGWTQDGERADGAGMKSVQCVRTPDGWRIAAVVWDDTRPGLALADHAVTAWPG